MRGPGAPRRKKCQHCSQVMPRSPGRPRTSPAACCCEGPHVHVLRVCLIKGRFMFPGAGVSFYFWAVISPLKVQNSSARFESTHSLLFLVCEWPEIVSIVIDLNFHFDDGNKYCSRPSLNRNKCFHSSPSNQSLWAKPRVQRTAEQTGQACLPPAPGVRELALALCFMAALLAPIPCPLSQTLPQALLWGLQVKLVNKMEPALPSWSLTFITQPNTAGFLWRTFPPTLTTRNSPRGGPPSCDHIALSSSPPLPSAALAQIQ